MGEKTAISWCDHTFNLWWGCEHAVLHPGRKHLTAPECANCYAEAFDRRLGGSHWGHGSPRRFFGDAYWAKLEKWNHDALLTCERRSVFVSSMSDVGEIHPDPQVNAQMDAARARFFELAKKLDCLDFLVITKRPENLADMLPWQYDAPPSNAWLGTSCGARSSLWRIRELRRVPAAHRFVSAEPLLEHITTEEWVTSLRGEANCPQCNLTRVKIDEDGCCSTCGADCHLDWGIDWLIVGHESGPKNKIRWADHDWVRSARDAAIACNIKFHFKQWHDGKKVVHLPMLDGRQWTATPSRD